MRSTGAIVLSPRPDGPGLLGALGHSRCARLLLLTPIHRYGCAALKRGGCGDFKQAAASNIHGPGPPGRAGRDVRIQRSAQHLGACGTQDLSSFSGFMRAGMFLNLKWHLARPGQSLRCLVRAIVLRVPASGWPLALPVAAINFEPQAVVPVGSCLTSSPSWPFHL